MEKKHPSFDIQGSKGNTLKGKQIVLGITGSVAAGRSPEIARELMRRGADVIPVFTEAAQRLIHPDLVHWSTGNTPVTKLTGEIEHVRYCGNVEKPADLFIIAPATANTIGKIAAAIDDTPVTTFATTAIGQGIPVIIVPAMHMAMYQHPGVIKNIEVLQNWGIQVMLPKTAEGKAKIASTEDICLAAEIAVSQSINFHGKRVLITAGRTVEYIDTVRTITNNSTGKMGIAIAEAAQAAGAEVTLIAGKTSIPLPESINIIKTETGSQMKQAVFNELENRKYDCFISCAAVSDYKVEKVSEEKISTHTSEKLYLELVPTEKILDQVKPAFPETYVVAFRAQTGLDRDGLIRDGVSRRKKAGADLIAVNDVGKPNQGFESEENELIVIDDEDRVFDIRLTTKNKAARELLEIIAQFAWKA
ncbi:MAG: bifunctional phosphopantothenoylcysteine decarboxylase/phosphopantothenate--cysteine ligase CoaBC [Spirochaetia bacterium]